MPKPKSAMNRAGGAEDTGLALAVHEGEPDAVERLVLGFQDQLFSYALGLLNDPSDAQEVTQDAFLRAHRALTRQYHSERCRELALRPWLYRITRNLAYNRRRGVPRNETSLEDADGWMPPAAVADPVGQQVAERDEAERTLWSAVGQLDQPDREVVLLRFMEDLPYAEIASVTGASEAAVRGKVFRALRRLRGSLSERRAVNAV